MPPPPPPLLRPLCFPIHPRPLSLPNTRSFSTSNPTLARSAGTAIEHRHAHVPPYPHGPRLLYKQSNFGLYGLAHPQFGNQVSEQNSIKTRRKWSPNIHSKRLWSDSLGRHVRVKVATRVLRTIDKCGGLDEYLLGEGKGRIKELGMEGWRLRWKIMCQGKGVKEGLRRKRVELGVPPGGLQRWLSDSQLLEGATEEEEKAEIREAGEEYSEGGSPKVGENEDVAQAEWREAPKTDAQRWLTEFKEQDQRGKKNPDV
ncbi:MAG: hypothetical protein Q9212_003724 [Teloschistes hypoglaucus]